MKNAMLISASLAMLLLSGCGDKEEIKPDVQDKASEIIQKEVVEDIKTDDSPKPIQSDVKNRASEITKDVVEEIEKASEQSETIALDVQDKASETTEKIVDDIKEKGDEIKEDIEQLVANEESGKELYAQKCQSCHGAQAEKKGLGKSGIIAGWDSAKIVELLKAYKGGELNQYGMAATMKATLANMSDEQMQKVAEYISTLK